MPNDDQTRPDTHDHDQPCTDAYAQPAPPRLKDHQLAESTTDHDTVAPSDNQVPQHDQPRTDTTIDEQARTDTHAPPPANWITIETALPRFAAAGAPRKLRTVQKYCGNGKLRCHLAMTEVGFKYYVDPSSIDELVAREAQMAPLGGGNDDEFGETSRHVQPRPDTHAGEQARMDAPATSDVYQHPYVRKLESRIDKLEEKYEAQVRRTEEIQNQARTELIQLQRANAISQSQTLAEYLLKAREFFIADAQADQRPPDGAGQ